MGGKGGSADKEAQRIAATSGKELTELAKSMSAEAAPWRKAAGEAYMTQLNDPYKATAAGQNALSRQTAQGLNAVAEMQPGGARDRASRDLRMNKITGSANLLNQGYDSAAQALGTLGVGQTQAGIGAYSGANQSANTLAQIGANQKSGLGAGAAGFGALLGGL
jgi:hypothetical protein